MNKLFEFDPSKNLISARKDSATWSTFHEQLNLWKEEMTGNLRIDNNLLQQSDFLYRPQIFLIIPHGT